MRILALNAGSGSLKASLYQVPSAPPLPDVADAPWKAGFNATSPERPPGRLLFKVFAEGEGRAAGTIDENAPVEERTRRLLELLWTGESPPLDGPQEVDAVVHRIVHGGDAYDAAVEVDESVEAVIAGFADAAPLHNPPGLAGIRVAREVFGKQVRQFAVFDTAFHRSLPPAAATYPGPREWLDRGIRRYGFHGTSFRWASQRAAKLMGRENDDQLRLILCHLGGGCSICASVGGRSVDTTMGYTPLDGIAMSSRPGALDPGILLHLLREGASVDELSHILNHECGLAGLSGQIGDTRILRPRAEQGDAAARLAIEVFVHRLCAGIGQLLPALEQPADAFVFTDIIGETEPAIRAAACRAFAFCGLRLDPEQNAASPLDRDIAAPGSAVRVFVIEAREAWQMVRECHPLMTRPTT